MLITAARIKNIKRVRDITIEPEADDHLLLIAGPNMAGKTSVLDAISMVIGGAKLVPTDPVHHGADEGFVQLEWDSGLIARRTIEPDGKSKLEVKDTTGKVASPQKLLERLLGQRLIDPLEFVRMDGKARRARLLEIIDTEKKIPAMDAHREKVYALREEVGRQLRDAKGERERLGPETEAGSPIDVAALSAEHGEIARKQQAGHRLELASKDADAAHDVAVTSLERTNKQIEETRAELDRLGRMRELQLENLAAAKKRCADAEATARAAAAEWSSLQPRREEIAAELGRANAHNSEVTSIELMNKRRTEAQAAVDQRQQKWNDQAAVLAKVDAKKLEFLKAAKLPVVGLGIAVDDVTFNDVPLAQASGAEKLRIALAIAVASQSEIQDILIRDAALLDDESLAIVDEVAQHSGCRVWLERVGTRDPGAIIIRDGVIAGEE